MKSPPATCIVHKAIQQRIDMITRPSKTVESREVAGQVKEDSVFVIKLNQLHHQANVERANLPSLCRIVMQTQRVQICRKVSELVESVISEQAEPNPFIFCCHAGAKVLVVPTEKSIYLSMGRNPWLGERHLHNIACSLGLDVSKTRGAWSELPKCGPAFIDKTMTKLEEDMGIELSAREKKALQRLGRAYEMYEFDNVIYDTLKRLSLEGGDHRGEVRIEFASRLEEALLVRVVRQPIGPDQPKVGIPLMGLVFEATPSANLLSSIDLPMVAELRTRASINRATKFVGDFRASLEDKWLAKVSIYLEEEPEKAWLNRAHEMICAGLDSGSGTVCTRLLRVLREGSIDRFQSALMSRAQCVADSAEFGGHCKLYSQILRDIADALDYVGAESLQNKARTTRVLGELLRFLTVLEPYLVSSRGLATAMTGPQGGLLVQDLLNGGFEYTTLMKNELIPSELARCSYDANRVVDLLQSWPDTTVGTLLKATERGDIGLDSTPGREVWGVVVDFYRRYGLSTELRCLEEQLYEAEASAGYQIFVNVCADFLGVVCKTAAFGTVHSHSIIERIRNSAYRRYVSRRLNRGPCYVAVIDVK